MSPPYWALILEAAAGDPLRAQEIEDQLTGEWWQRWTAWYPEKVQQLNRGLKIK